MYRELSEKTVLFQLYKEVIFSISTSPTPKGEAHPGSIETRDKKSITLVTVLMSFTDFSDLSRHIVGLATVLVYSGPLYGLQLSSC